MKDFTATEKKLWHHLRANRLRGLKFRRQHPLGPFLADFYCYAARLVVEVDGPIHDSKQARDVRRDEWMDAHGYSVLRFDNARVGMQLTEVLEEIAKAARICQGGE